MARGTDWIFGGTVLASVALESYALAALVASSFAPMRALVHGSPVAAAVVRGLNLTALNAIAVTLIILLLHVVTAARRERDGADTGYWLEHLAEGLVGDPQAAQPRPTRAALEAMLQLQDTLSGIAGERATELLRRSGLVRAGALSARFRTRFSRLEAFEILARARLPETLPVIHPFLADRDDMLRFAAARAAARVADAATAPDLAQRLAGTTFGSRAWLEILLIARAPLPLVRTLLASRDPAARWAAVEAVGRRYLLTFAGDVAGLLSEDDAELLAAALRALARLRYPPAGREALVLAAARSEPDFVRLQAVRVLALLGGEEVAAVLWDRLADPSFYVRQAAARALETTDATLLLRASQSHPDRYGRAMARQALPVAHAA